MGSVYNVNYCLKYINSLHSNELDVRETHDARFSDQKCTPDIVCFIADCIQNSWCYEREFTIKDLWQTDFFGENIQIIFHKPNVDDRRAQHEYDKVLAQPLKLLAYAKVLGVKRDRRRLVFWVKEKEMLDWIARNDRNAFLFLGFYFDRVMECTDLTKHFTDYKNAVDSGAKIRDARTTLYNHFHTLLRDCTPTKSKLDAYRIFHKVFNLFAYNNKLPGSGEELLHFYDLMYNRENWRDIGKDKSQSRQEFNADLTTATQTSQETSEDDDSLDPEIFTNYYVNKAIRQIKSLHYVSEVPDQYGKGPADQVHHIFPRAEFPKFAAYVENLILLTATQHLSLAHPNNNTHLIDPDYQHVCLLCKADTIEKNIRQYGERYYRKDLFVEVVNGGLSLSLPEEVSFKQIKESIIQQYNHQ